MISLSPVSKNTLVKIVKDIYADEGKQDNHIVYASLVPAVLYQAGVSEKGIQE